MTMRNRDQENSHKVEKTMGNTLKNQATRTRLKQYMQTFLFEAFGYLCSSVILGLWFLFIIWFLLSGCSTTSETFDCKEGKGVGCKSITEVNRMVDQGMLRDGNLGEGGSVSTMPPPPSIILADYPDENNVKKPAGFTFSDGIVVQRIQDEPLRVWMAPFQDDQGNLHEASIIHTVLKPGYWSVANAPVPGVKLQVPGEENN
jgi:conjugal transfer pilus assembly protein TraV